jgi:hypothetical protein
VAKTINGPTMTYVFPTNFSNCKAHLDNQEEEEKSHLNLVFNPIHHEEEA